jgi:hypothetical protein
MKSSYFQGSEIKANSGYLYIIKIETNLKIRRKGKYDSTSYGEKDEKKIAI